MLARGVIVAVALVGARAAWAGEGADPFGPQLEWTPIVGFRARLSGAGDPLPDQREVGQVARVGIEAQRGILSARVSVQEARAWTGGSEPGSASAQGSFAPELAEGWARLDGALSPSVGARLTVGRQGIALDNGRIIGLRSWDLQPQMLDALRFELQAAPLSVELVNARRFDASSTDDVFSLGVTAARLGVGRDGPNADGRLDLVSVVDARRTASVSTTTGVYGDLAAGRALATGEAYVQQNPDGTGVLASAELGYVLGRSRAWVLRGRYVQASGAEGPGGAVVAFQPVLGDTHDQFGLLDLVQLGDDARGLADLCGQAELQASARLGVRAAVHLLTAPNGPTYGVETDAALTFHITPFAALDLGLGQISGGERGLHAGGHLQLAVAM